MSNAIRVLLPLLLWACAPAPLPAPSIESVEPRQVPAGVPSVLAVRVSGVLPWSVDYHEQSMAPEPVTVHLAGQAVDIPFAQPDGTLFVPVSEGLPLGGHEIRVTLADGREAVREGAFAVVHPSALIEPGEEGVAGGEDAPGTEGAPAGKRRVFGFRIEHPGRQERNVPFKVAIHALGPGAQAYNEPITLRASKGQVSMHGQSAFSDGVRVETISLSGAGSRLYLMVEDTQGRRGLSPPFDVQ